jgi:hypothetical protein
VRRYMSFPVAAPAALRSWRNGGGGVPGREAGEARRGGTVSRSPPQRMELDAWGRYTG